MPRLPRFRKRVDPDTDVLLIVTNGQILAWDGDFLKNVYDRGWIENIAIHDGDLRGTTFADIRRVSLNPSAWAQRPGTRSS